MNPPADPSPDSAALRAEIDQTRRRMDQTIDALGERFHGRHLVDEALHFFRNQTQNGNMNKFKDTLTRSANSAARSVVETVKSDPIPIALVGAGVALYLYNRARSGQSSLRESDYRDYRHQVSDENDFGWDDPRGKQDGGDFRGEEGGSEGDSGSGVGQRLHQAGERVKEKAQAAVDATREMGEQVADRSRRLYRNSRERVAETIETHPLETGLVCLALGLVAGIALPASGRVRRQVARPARALRRRADSMIASGRQVIRSAADAARDEAKAQGLTLDPSKSRGPRQAETSGSAQGGGEQAQLPREAPSY
jgi:hypothetical protein